MRDMIRCRLRRAVSGRASLAAAACALMVLMTAPAPVWAQSSEVRSLANRINQLERDLMELQRQYYRDGGGDAGASAGSGGQVAAPAASGGGAGVAVISRRVDGLEQALQRLTGQVEEASHRVDRVSSRLDKLVADVDFRLSAIEKKMGLGLAGTAGQDAADQTAGAGAEGAATDAGRQAAAGGEGGAASSGQGTQPGSLGSISEDDLSRVREGSGQAAASSGASDGAGQVVALSDAGPEEQYEGARALLLQGDVAGAEQAFRGFLDRYPDNALAGNAQYWLGETYYVRQQYNDAARAFLKGYQDYHDSSKAPDSLLKLALTLSNIGQKEEACATLMQLGKEFPDAPSNVTSAAERESKRMGCAAS